MSNTWVRIRNSAPLLAVALLLLATPGRSQGDGATMFKSKCAACHGADGKADTTMGKALKIRDLGSQPVQSQPDAQLTEIVTKGKNKMPPFGEKLSNEQVTELVAYVRGLAKRH
jgi:cytochrome c6